MTGPIYDEPAESATGEDQALEITFDQDTSSEKPAPPLPE